MAGPANRPLGSYSGKSTRHIAKIIAARTRREVKKAVSSALQTHLVALGLDALGTRGSMPVIRSGTSSQRTTSKTTTASLKGDQIGTASSKKASGIARSMSLEALDVPWRAASEPGGGCSWISGPMKVLPETLESLSTGAACPQINLPCTHEVKLATAAAWEEVLGGGSGATDIESSHDACGSASSDLEAGAQLDLPCYSVLRPPLRSPRGPYEARSTTKPAQSLPLSEKGTPSEQSTTCVSVLQSQQTSGRSVSCPSNETSSCSPPCKRGGGYSDVRQWRTEALVEQGLRRGSLSSMLAPYETPINAYEASPASVTSEDEESLSRGNELTNALLFGVRICGVIPFYDHSACRLLCRPSTYYQWLMLVVACVSAYICATSLLGDVEVSEAGQLRMFSDVPLALGCIFGLLAVGAHAGSSPVIALKQLLLAYARTEDALSQWMRHSRRDLAITWAAWLAAVACRVLLACLDEELSAQQRLHTLASLFACTVIMALCGFMLHICRALFSLIDNFCVAVHDWALEELDWTVATWNVLQAMLRKASGTLQSCLFVLQAVAVSTFFLLGVDLRRNLLDDDGGSWRTYIAVAPGFLIILEIGRVLQCAAAVTDKCTQLPSLINTLGETLDPKRQAVVQYVAVSAAGFHVNEVRVDSALLVKCVYLCCVATFAIATQVGRHS